MKLCKFKKVLALATSFSLLGASILGASALSLKDYPQPFIKDGTPASNLVLVVGDSAVASDVVAMGNIIASLQQLSVKEEEIASKQPKKVEVEGDYVELSSPTNLLEINETIGEVTGSLSEFDLGFLKGGSISTGSGVTKYNQYIQFNDSAQDPSKRVIFTEDNFDNVGDFLYFRNGDQIFDWVLEFEEGLTSSTSNTNSASATLENLNDREVTILGSLYTIVNAVVDTTVVNGRVRIDLIGGQAFGEMGEHQNKSVTIGENSYDVEVMVLSETNGEALIRINGKVLPKIKPGEAVPLPSGELFGVRDIITTGKETQSSVLRFYIGANKITFEDSNFADGKFSDGGARVNNEQIEDSAVEIGGTLNSGKSEFTINHVKYRLKANGLSGDVLVPAGHGVREYINEPEGMLAPLWDIKYNGLSDVPLTTLKIDASGRDEYNLRFTNQEGLNYRIPIASLRFDGNMRHGEASSGAQRGLWNVEDNDETTRYFINPEDYVILSDINSGSSTFLDGAGNKQLSYSGCVRPTSTSDNTAFTRVLKYQSATNVSGDIGYSFTDLASGSKQVKANSTGGFDLVVGGKTYSGLKDKDSNKISMDVNGDGVFSQQRLSWIATEGGMIVGLNSTPTSTLSTGETTASVLGNHSCITFTTAAKQFDEGQAQNGGSLNIAIPIRNSGGVIQLNMNDILGIPKPIFLTTNPAIRQQLDDYGGLLEFYDPGTTETPQKLTYEYPLTQRGGDVIVTGGPVLIGEAKALTNTKIQPLPLGISKLASEVVNITDHNAIVIGGPCANIWADYLMELPRPCQESIPENSAFVQLFEHKNGNVALLVAGFSSEDTKRAAKAVENLEIKRAGDAKKAKVLGTISNVVVNPV
ncbi:hypothetical protein HZA97_08955 [Candidatus Woesearchaeota archaeon]|nr:hypothetical protein [Candidatus Woesearchaeota archaeon]